TLFRSTLIFGLCYLAIRLYGHRLCIPMVMFRRSAPVTRLILGWLLHRRALTKTGPIRYRPILRLSKTLTLSRKVFVREVFLVLTPITAAAYSAVNGRSNGWPSVPVT